MAPSPGPSLPIAIWVSRLFHPFVVPLPVLVVALVLSGCSWRAALGWTLLCVGVVIVPSVLLLVLERRRRGDGDWFVTVREQRRSLYALGGLCLLVLLGILLLAGAPRLLLASLAALLVAWARVRLEHHTPSQALLGAGITASCVALGLHLLA